MEITLLFVLQKLQLFPENLKCDKPRVRAEPDEPQALMYQTPVILSVSAWTPCIRSQSCKRCVHIGRRSHLQSADPRSYPSSRGRQTGNKIWWMLLELRQLIRHISIDAADFAVFNPQQVERYAAFLQFLVHIFVIRHFVFRFAFCSGIQQISKLLIRHSIGKRIGEVVCLCKPQYLDHGST